MKISDSTKLVLSVITLFCLIVFSFQKNKSMQSFRPLEVKFQSKDGMKSIKNYQDKIVLLYFGFLTCPEACPTTLSHVGAAFNRLTKEELNKIEMIFIDLDPERDTLEKMISYTSFFHPKIISFWANLETLTPFARFFGIQFQKVKIKSTMNYTIDHSTDIIVLSPKGEILDEIHHGTDANLMTNILRKLIAENLK